MPSESEIQEILVRYTKLFSDGDADGVAALYAEDATIEDPLGAPLIRGRSEIRAFYGRAADTGATIRLDGPVRVRHAESAAPLVAQVTFGDRRVEIEIVDVMTFSSDGLIRSMRAFWGDVNVRPLT
jgi:steroid delta-isomerase